MGRPHRREDRARSPSTPCATSCRCSGWSTRPAPASPTRSSCSPAAAAPGASSTTRCKLSGKVPQICCLFGPSAAGGRLHPELLRHRDHGRGQRLDVPGLAPHGRDGDQRADDARGDGRRPHARHRVGLRRQPRRRRRRRHRPGPGVLHLPADDRGGDDPPTLRGRPRRRAPFDRRPRPGRRARRPTTCTTSSTRSSTPSRSSRSSRCSPPSWSSASACSTAGRSASWPTTRRPKGGVLFVDSADKAARFIWCCDAFNVPLVFLADVPGFMIGTEVERQGIIRHGAKMVTAVSEATVPKVSVIVRKAYGAGLYAMSGPGVRARGHHRPAHRQDRGDGPRGGGQRRVRQQDRRHRGPRRAGRVRRRAAPASTRRTSTCCAWRRSW